MLTRADRRPQNASRGSRAPLPCAPATRSMATTRVHLCVPRQPLSRSFSVASAQRHRSRLRSMMEPIDRGPKASDDSVRAASRCRCSQRAQGGGCWSGAAACSNADVCAGTIRFISTEVRSSMPMMHAHDGAADAHSPCTFARRLSSLAAPLRATSPPSGWCRLTRRAATPLPAERTTLNTAAESHRSPHSLPIWRQHSRWL